MPSQIQWPFPVKLEKNVAWKCQSRFVILAVATWSKILASWMNRISVQNSKVIYDAVLKRKEGTPLITVTNHYSCFDDPVLWGMFPWRIILSPSLNRWTPSAEEICFYNKVIARFFALGQCVPVVRGDGVHQPAMDFSVALLNAGKWVHMFPEGKVNALHQIMRFKWGVGRLVMDCERDPLVIPMWHCGMDNVLPNRKPHIPKVGKKIDVLIGDPIDCKTLRELNVDEITKRKAITDRIQETMYALKDEAELLHKES